MGTQIEGKVHRGATGGDGVPLFPDGYTTAAEIAALAPIGPTGPTGTVGPTGPSGGPAGPTGPTGTAGAGNVKHINSAYTAINGDLLLVDPSERRANDLVTNGTATITSATVTFVTTDVGKPVVGTNIPANTYIGIVNSTTSAGLSSSATSNVPVNATGSATGQTIQIGGPIPITLPSPTLDAQVQIKKIDAGLNAVTAIGTIDGFTNDAITDPYACHTYAADGSVWWRI